MRCFLEDRIFRSAERGDLLHSLFGGWLETAERTTPAQSGVFRLDELMVRQKLHAGKVPEASRDSCQGLDVLPAIIYPGNHGIADLNRNAGAVDAAEILQDKVIGNLGAGAMDDGVRVL
jgi:hypothetical protein